MQGRLAASALIYESVAEGERFQHSERLALCRYRLFTIGLSDSQDVNLHAANQFEPYVERLDEADQLDALKHLSDVYASMHRWQKVDELAELLGEKALLQYKHLRKGSEQKQPARPLIYYIMYSRLMRSAAWSERGNYKQALHFALLTIDVSWYQTTPSEAEQRVIDQFMEWTTANIYLFQVMSGQIEVLPDYVNYVEQHENEIFPALYKITQAANRYKLNIDDILERFKQHFQYKDQESRLGKFSKQVTGDLHASFLAELAMYYLHSKKFDIGLNYLLASLESSINIKSDSSILRCVGLFEKHRRVASAEHIRNYTNFISEVQRINEEKDCIMADIS
ncbi:hypothetical protein D3C73_757180 [compost metagenome]